MKRQPPERAFRGLFDRQNFEQLYSLAHFPQRALPMPEKRFKRFPFEGVKGEPFLFLKERFPLAFPISLIFPICTTNGLNMFNKIFREY